MIIYGPDEEPFKWEAIDDCAIQIFKKALELELKNNKNILSQCPYYKNGFCKAESALFLTEKCENFPDCIFRKYQRKIHECKELRKKIGERT